MVAYSSSPFSLLPPLKKRKAYFAFHFDDIMRVNNVRQAWKIDHPDAPHMRSFYDSSLWESRKLEGDEALKRLIREGVEYTSAVCVLIGTETWSRRWVKYEIARAAVDNRGLLAVHLNNINHHMTRTVHQLGPNPLEHLAVGKTQPNVFLPPQYYLFEQTLSGWIRYGDYTAQVQLPNYLPDPRVGYVSKLSLGAVTYDLILHDGHKNIGRWINHAAQAVGR